MPLRINITALSRSFPFRQRPQGQWPARSVARFTPAPCRMYSDSKQLPAADRSQRNDAKPLEHVSEEKAKVAEAMGEQGPDLSQGTPVEEVCDNFRTYYAKASNDILDRQRRQGRPGEASKSHEGSTQVNQHRHAQGHPIILNDGHKEERKQWLGHGPC